MYIRNDKEIKEKTEKRCYDSRKQKKKKEKNNLCKEKD